ncbi:hypothetical protein F3Y22_tig00002840pilonHSYRG00913 [Hibiscus syriacus]|uniref:BED-type domain-containing protein n=1 Tax=Hibiscus syriacus TaxID=106335 RepID=A0A6A3CRP0_HIBSY|nr:hypothetical protein F3Y22_tig00002840pilonHSYRG00913 [Hibiscus syriacus]
MRSKEGDKKKKGGFLYKLLHLRNTKTEEQVSSESSTFSIKLLIDEESNKVILAEAGNDFIDTHRSLFSFPLGNIARLVGKYPISHPGCLSNLYNSVKNLSLNNFRSHACKSMLLHPISIHEDKLKNLKLPVDFTEPTKYFAYPNQKCREKQGVLLSNNDTSRCYCGELMSLETRFQAGERDAVTDETERGLCDVESMFFITDDLRVIQGYPGGLISFLSHVGVENVDHIAVTVLKICSKAMSDLLSHSLFSRFTFTDVFIRKKSDRKILCAEAGENFVDLLISFLTIPLESVLELLGGNLLQDKYWWQLVHSQTAGPKASPRVSTTNSSGYVKKMWQYVVTDGLVVKSLSSVSSIALLRGVGIRPDDVEQEVMNSNTAESSVGGNLEVVRVIEHTRNKDIWDHYDLCEMSNGSRRARCKLCLKFLASEGNTTLKNHLTKSCKALRSRSDPSQSNLTPQGGVFVYDNEKLREAFTKFVITKALPFDHFDDEDFTTTIQQLMQPRYTQVSRTTLRRDAIKMWRTAREKMILGFQEHRYGVSLTCDVWSSPHNTGNSFLAVTSHWLDQDNWQMMKRTIAFELFEKEAQFPILAAMARDLLTVQASTVASESAFSVSGRVISQRRSRLSPESVEVCICLKDYLDGAARKQHITTLEDAIDADLEANLHIEEVELGISPPNEEGEDDEEEMAM